MWFTSRYARDFLASSCFVWKVLTREFAIASQPSIFEYLQTRTDIIALSWESIMGSLGSRALHLALIALGVWPLPRTLLCVTSNNICPQVCRASSVSLAKSSVSKRNICLDICHNHWVGRACSDACTGNRIWGHRVQLDCGLTFRAILCCSRGRWTVQQTAKNFMQACKQTPLTFLQRIYITWSHITFGPLWISFSKKSLGNKQAQFPSKTQVVLSKS